LSRALGRGRAPAKGRKRLSTQASWPTKTPTVSSTPSFEVEDVTSAKVVRDGGEFRGSGITRIVGNSAALRRVLSMVRLVAPTDATVLVNGETGTGKELIAEAIHKCSDRSNGPFVKVNCAAIPEGLLESELFGHERGAYTGAVARSIGRFERANRGTLFLDEIGDLPVELQPKILRVIQERQFERLGGGATIHTDVRVICATHRNLIEMVHKREFRADLFYRLSVFPIELPALRDRPEDIPLLVCHFARDCAARLHKRITAISEEFMAAAARHLWPGNIRELQNFVERSVILSTGAVLNGSLPELNCKLKVAGAVTLKEAERSHILQILRQTEGVVGGREGAAARLGLPRTTLIAKMKRLGIDNEQSSALPVRAAVLVPITGDPRLQIPPLSEPSHMVSTPGHFTAQSDMGNMFRLVDAEREHILDVVEMTDGLISGEGGAAEVLGVPPSTLRSRMKKLGIKSQT
jgi:transcriptional regulator with GAF, ATPase, and Fis domain